MLMRPTGLILDLEKKRTVNSIAIMKEVYYTAMSVE